MQTKGPALPILVVTVAVVVAVAALVVVTTWGDPPDSEPAGASAVPTTSGVAQSAEAEAAAILREWDEARAAAWAAGDERALRTLYVAGSTVGEQDLAMLRAWVTRGFRVEGMRMQVSSIDVRRHDDRRLVLRVTDRLAAAVAVRADGTRRALPRDRASTRRLVFRRTAGSWRLAASYASAEPTTAATSGSANS